MKSALKGIKLISIMLPNFQFIHEGRHINSKFAHVAIYPRIQRNVLAISKLGTTILTLHVQGHGFSDLNA